MSTNERKVKGRVEAEQERIRLAKMLQSASQPQADTELNLELEGVPVIWVSTSNRDAPPPPLPCMTNSCEPNHSPHYFHSLSMRTAYRQDPPHVPLSPQAIPTVRSMVFQALKAVLRVPMASHPLRQDLRSYKSSSSPIHHDRPPLAYLYSCPGDR
ncbi:hypothetical protein CONLIGDRAFT_685951 [Coniochaeta ligniaria NRRL 30616]|uniref:Uncharacterized protein n=1 Tax=Coniochaeta ligniaria NRRL 30616 TaxID=1408157 RepID=A0A1J7J3D3_9PEZI|nr:hypothetical protein CONLIGDRAFT_685951 [Coniochaeta ligniaria NRRL 30616]